MQNAPHCVHELCRCGKKKVVISKEMKTKRPWASDGTLKIHFLPFSPTDERKRRRRRGWSDARSRTAFHRRSCISRCVRLDKQYITTRAPDTNITWLVIALHCVLFRIGTFCAEVLKDIYPCRVFGPEPDFPAQERLLQWCISPSTQLNFSDLD